MEGTDIYTGNKDTSAAHDHTYYGNGCSNGWGTGGDGGSSTSCTTRLVTTYDSVEIQKNGTYFHFQAATSGSGGSINTDNTDAPDSFCPLGWQLPYGGTGGDYYDKSKSRYFLLGKYNYGDNLNGNIGVMSYPLDYVYNGRYRWSSALLYFQGNQSAYWHLTSSTGGTAPSFILWYGSVKIASIADKADGDALRCVLGISNLEKLSMASAFTH